MPWIGWFYTCGTILTLFCPILFALRRVTVSSSNETRRGLWLAQAKEWEKQQRKLAALKKGGQSRGKAEETVRRLQKIWKP